MSMASVRLFSDGLGTLTRYTVILPNRGEGPFPVLIQLHGLGDDEAFWIERSSLVCHVVDLPLIVALRDPPAPPRQLELPD